MKKRALRIGAVAGIDLFVHWTFGLLIAGVPAFYMLTGNTAFEAFFVLGLLLAAFACVVLHEFGHALVARRYDVSTSDITLYPIGGVARLQRIPSQPMQEFWIAVAGPAVNVAIALILFVCITAFGGFPPAEALATEIGGYFWTKLLGINVILVAFNLLPAFPMDGGRVLRALLALRMNYLKATQIAARTGQGMAILFGLVGLFAYNPILLFIALFVFLGAQQESHAATVRTVIHGIPVQDVMMTRFETLSPKSTLQDAVSKLLGGSEHAFPVVENGNHPVGVLTRRDLVKALNDGTRAEALFVADVMRTSYPSVNDDDSLETAYRQMREQQCPVALITRDGQLIGLQSMDNVGEYVMITKLRKHNDKPT